MAHETYAIPETGAEALSLEGFGTIENFLDHAIKELPGFFSNQYLQMAWEMKKLEDEEFDPLVVFKVWKKRCLIETFKKTFDGYHSVRDEALDEVLRSFDTTHKMCMEYEKTNDQQKG